MSKATRPLFFQAWAQYRDNWPRPFDVVEGNPQGYGQITELINGQMATAREFMKNLDSQP
jgi:hypothetical protein